MLVDNHRPRRNHRLPNAGPDNHTPPLEEGGASSPHHSPPDWTVGCQATRGGLPIACDARPPLIGWRKRSLLLLRVELRPEATKAPPTSSAKNTCVMATGSSAGWRAVVIVVVVAKDVINLTIQ